jgi:hypothetical protein
MYMQFHQYASHTVLWYIMLSPETIYYSQSDCAKSPSIRCKLYFHWTPWPGGEYICKLIGQYNKLISELFVDVGTGLWIMTRVGRCVRLYNVYFFCSYYLHLELYSTVLEFCWDYFLVYRKRTNTRRSCVSAIYNMSHTRTRCTLDSVTLYPHPTSRGGAKLQKHCLISNPIKLTIHTHSSISRVHTYLKRYKTPICCQ